MAIRGNWFSSIAEKSNYNMTNLKNSIEPQTLKWEIGDILVNTVTKEKWLAYNLIDMWWTDIVTGEKYEYPTLQLFNTATGESNNWRVDRLSKAYFYNETSGETEPHNLDELLKAEATNDLEDYYKSKTIKRNKKDKALLGKQKEEERVAAIKWAQQKDNLMPTIEYQQMYDSLEKEMDEYLKKETAKLISEHYDNNMRIGSGSKRRKQ